MQKGFWATPRFGLTFYCRLLQPDQKTTNPLAYMHVPLQHTQGTSSCSVKILEITVSRNRSALWVMSNATHPFCCGEPKEHLHGWRVYLFPTQYNMTRDFAELNFPTSFLPICLIINPDLLLVWKTIDCAPIWLKNITAMAYPIRVWMARKSIISSEQKRSYWLKNSPWSKPVEGRRLLCSVFKLRLITTL